MVFNLVTWSEASRVISAAVFLYSAAVNLLRVMNPLPQNIFIGFEGIFESLNLYELSVESPIS